MALLKQKMTWLSIAIVLVVLTVFGAAMMGAVVGTKPKDVPVALVVLDQAAEQPNGGALAAGEMIKEKLTGNSALPVVWSVVDSEEQARAGLDEREYYGALVLPADLSRGLLSLAAPEPKPAEVTILVNEGLNTQAATVVRQMMDQAMRMAALELSRQMLGRLGQLSEQIPAGTAQAFLTPIVVKEEMVHSPGANHANGNAPGLLTQIMWIGSLVTAMSLFLAGQKAGGGRWASVALQASIGLGITGIASGFVVWMASSWYGMELANAGETWMLLWLAAAAFFLLQSSLLNWIGLPAMALLVLLMFFSMPLLSMAPEFLSQATRDWIYSWTPLRFASGGLREVMYFGGWSAVGSNATVLWSLAGGFLALLLASGVKKARTAAEGESSRLGG
ncbi:YhgE/Pip domain-containing protein [Cohnella hongkongensis]|uniref:YhgE/Pip domain-containing protein n=1 Tax=Cohnella hongkongensis TaxID=178337 RepID=A0ABV9FKQ1_9BACL